MGRKSPDITGMRFGRLTAIERDYTREPKSGVFWVFVCDCGKTKSLISNNVIKGFTSSCGCYNSERASGYDLTGKVFGELTVLGRNDSLRKRKSYTWNCLCTCGKIAVVRRDSLLSGHTKSCGCLTHKFSGGRTKPEGEAAFNSVYNNYRRGALERGYSFELTKDEFKGIIFDNCAYCNKPPAIVSGKQKYNGVCIHNGADRIDNTKGYVSGNVVPCCTLCNQMKLDHTFEDFKEHIACIYRCLYGELQNSLPRVRGK